MVCDTVNPSFLAASCWRVEVVNGGAGVRRSGFFCMEAMVNLASLHFPRKASASSRVGKRRSSSARISLPATTNCAVTRKYGSALKACTSRSRSTMSRTATDCTRPAESCGFTLRQSTGESLKPTRRSSIRRACWALARFMSRWRGCSMASRMAFFVISWNTMRLVLFSSKPSTSQRCHEIASPSRSSSEASHTFFAFLAQLLSSDTTFFFSSGISYSGSSDFMSILISFFFKSRMWP